MLFFIILTGKQIAKDATHIVRVLSDDIISSGFGGRVDVHVPLSAMNTPPNVAEDPDGTRLIIDEGAADYDQFSHASEISYEEIADTDQIASASRVGVSPNDNTAHGNDDIERDLKEVTEGYERQEK